MTLESADDIRVLELRDQGLTQEEIARVCGFSQPKVSRILRSRGVKGKPGRKPSTIKLSIPVHETLEDARAENREILSDEEKPAIKEAMRRLESKRRWREQIEAYDAGFHLHHPDFTDGTLIWEGRNRVQEEERLRQEKEHLDSIERRRQNAEGMARLAAENAARQARWDAGCPLPEDIEEEPTVDWLAMARLEWDDVAKRARPGSELLKRVALVEDAVEKEQLKLAICIVLAWEPRPHSSDWDADGVWTGVLRVLEDMTAHAERVDSVDPNETENKSPTDQQNPCVSDADAV